jgi:acetylornithine deacetylase/succinyl-diaminopimelate desuccinylase-like protein
VPSRLCNFTAPLSAREPRVSRYGLTDENAHAPDEKLDLGNFHNGIIASAFLYEEIANT